MDEHEPWALESTVKCLLGLGEGRRAALPCTVVRTCGPPWWPEPSGRHGRERECVMGWDGPMQAGRRAVGNWHTTSLTHRTGDRPVSTQEETPTYRSTATS